MRLSTKKTFDPIIYACDTQTNTFDYFTGLFWTEFSMQGFSYLRDGLSNLGDCVYVPRKGSSPAQTVA